MTHDQSIFMAKIATCVNPCVGRHILAFGILYAIGSGYPNQGKPANATGKPEVAGMKRLKNRLRNNRSVDWAVYQETDQALKDNIPRKGKKNAEEWNTVKSIKEISVEESLNGWELKRGSGKAGGLKDDWAGQRSRIRSNSMMTVAGTAKAMKKETVEISKEMVWLPMGATCDWFDKRQ